MNFMNGRITKNGQWTFHQEGTEFKAPVGDGIQRKLTPGSGDKVTLGIRPEHIYADRLTGISTLAPFTAQIDVVEPVGNEIFVYFSTGTDTHYVARIASDKAPAVGMPFELLVDTSKMHFFDTTSEITL